MTTIKNGMPHPVNIVDEEGNIIRTFPKSESPIRLVTQTVNDGMLDGILITRTEIVIKGLPEKQIGVAWIVPRIVLSHYRPERNDLLALTEPVQDTGKHILGYRSLGR